MSIRETNITTNIPGRPLQNGNSVDAEIARLQKSRDIAVKIQEETGKDESSMISWVDNEIAQLRKLR